MKIRQLTARDLELYQKMQTGLDSDYMLRAFERLATSSDHQLFGLFIDDQLATIAGYSVFPGGYAMLGRLRSDQRFRGRGYATEINKFMIDDVRKSPEINWVGGYTNIQNVPARQILKKLDIPEFQTYHSFPPFQTDLLSVTPGAIWSSITDLA